ncbi:EAL domain-containing protein [Pararhizobium sp. IMCC21322]|uniref:bifunctional diguanylate cyclase/phosphodiesterase n=1 Tax=Pararhizobium sp. IMCC21322 TaxID=3067903 RepID=UPI0027426FC5|nr:EAL domain-containing protein [Pararhizobium sp. IMCC21322]
MTIPAPIPSDEAERLATLRRFAILDTEKERAFDRITDFAAKNFDVPIAIISLVDTDRQWFKASCGLDTGQTPRDLAFCAYTILSDDVHFVPDATKDKRFAKHPLVTGDMGIRFYCGAPLIAENGQRIGSLCLIDTKPRPDFTKDQQERLAELAAMVVDQMEMRLATGDVLQEIEYRHEAQHKAAVTERQMRALIEHVPTGIALVDRNGHYLATSQSWRAFLSSVEASKSDHDILDFKNVHPGWLRAFKKALKGETTLNLEDAVQLSDGTVEYLRWEACPWKSGGDEIEGVVISATLVSTQVLARKHAENQTEMLNAVLENVKDGVVACDAEGRLTMFNHATRVMHGIDCKPLPPEECSEFYSLFEADGTTPLTAERVPLFEALAGTSIVDREMLIAPNDLPERHIVAQASQLLNPDGTLLGAVASMTDVTAQKHAANQLKASEAHANYVAFHDTLTGLPNRAKFRQMIEHKENSLTDQMTAAFFLDLNQFKAVNDLMGHKIGDDLLKRTADVLTEIAGSEAFVGRLGGDEFIVFKPVMDSEEAVKLGQQMVHEISKPMVRGGHTVASGASVGIALYPEHGEDHDELMRRADLAMYKAKSLSDGNPVLFDPVMELETIQRRALEMELGQAVNNNELEVYFQPIVDGQTQETVGVEALVRWNHPTRGLVSPVEFIPVAEESGSIVEIGDWVLRTAMTTMANRPELFLSVNLSPVQFRDAFLVERVFNAVDETGFDPKRLELEVTEGLLIYDASVARRTIETFKSRGIRIALDDFGTGYSSLGYIQSFPFDKVKIDRSFVSDIDINPQSAAVVQCVVNLAASIGMEVTAEGIETKSHEMLLKFIGCNTLQGFRYGKPMPAAEFEAFSNQKKKKLA